MKCTHCGHDLQVGIATRVSIHGMYDCHLFHKIEATSVEGIVQSWLDHNKNPIPRKFIDGREVPDIGPSSLCPAIVLDENGKELRRVGQMVLPKYPSRAPDPEKVELYVQTLLKDPDISRILAQQ